MSEYSDDTEIYIIYFSSVDCGDDGWGSAGRQAQEATASYTCENYQGGKATATRHSSAGNLQYEYELERYYANTGTKCTGTNANGQALCADFCGIEDYTAPCCSDGSATAGNGTNCNTPDASDQ